MTHPEISAAFRADRPFASEVSEVAAALGTAVGGLTADEAAARLDTVGPNLLPEPKRTPAVLRFLSHFNDTLIYILAHKSRAAAEASFKAFREDPTWIEARKASEDRFGGSLTVPNGVKSVFMRPTDYSAIR